MTASSPPARPRDGRAVLVYSVARAGLLAACLVLGWVAGLDGALLVVVALFVSGALSWFLLARQRLAMGVAVERSVRGVRTRLQARTVAEDTYVDQMRATDDADHST